MKIAYGMIAQNRLSEMPTALGRVIDVVDHSIVVDGGSIDGSLENLWGLQPRRKHRNDQHVLLRPWRDDFCWSRNQYLEEAKRLGCDWIVVSDTDEWFSKDTAANLRTIIETYDDMGFRCVAFRDEPVTLLGGVEWERNVVMDPDKAFFKPLAAKLTPGLRYEGNPHHGWVWPEHEGDRFKPIANAPIQFCYSHRKEKIGTVAHRGARNAYVAGGGDNEKPRKWREFRAAVNAAFEPEKWRFHAGVGRHGREIDPDCHTCLNMVPWHAFDRALIEGRGLRRSYSDGLADTGSLGDFGGWILTHRHDDTRGGDSEVRELYILAYRLYHPEMDPFPDDRIKGQEVSLEG